jgi:hypothetical protein
MCYLGCEITVKWYVLQIYVSRFQFSVGNCKFFVNYREDLLFSLFENKKTVSF